MTGESKRHAECEKARVVSPRPERDPERAPHDDPVQDQHRGKACEAELFADDREHEIGVGGGDEMRVAETDTVVRSRDGESVVVSGMRRDETRATQGEGVDTLGLPLSEPRPWPLQGVIRKVAPFALPLYRRLDAQEI